MAAKKASHGGAREGAGRPRKGRDDVTIKFDRALAAKAKFVAEMRGITAAEYLSELHRAEIDRDFAAEGGIKEKR